MSRSPNLLTLQPACQLPRWDEFVANHPGGSLFHTIAMVRALKHTAEYEPLALAAVDACGEIAGLMVATKISLAGVWPSALSSRSVFFADPIASDNEIGRQALTVLLSEHDHRVGNHVVFSEIRPLDGRNLGDAQYREAGYERFSYKNYELDLTVPADDIFRRMSPKRRNNIRANERRGLSVREGDPHREIALFYDHLVHSYTRSRMPLVGIGYFEQLFSRFNSDEIRLTIAELNGKPIASACHLFFKGRVYWSHAGTYRIRGIAAQASLVWETILWSIARGHRIYDFAGAGWADESYGPGIFKERFGGNQVDVGRYRKVYSKWRMKIAETGYRVTRSLLNGPSADQPCGDEPPVPARANFDHD